MKRKQKVELANQLLDDFGVDFFDIDGVLDEEEMDYFLRTVKEAEVDRDECSAH